MSIEKMEKQLFGKFGIVLCFLLLISSCLSAQQDSIYYQDSVFILYSNGIFKTQHHTPQRWIVYHETSGIWTIVQDSLIRLKSFDEYKCEVLNVQAYYDSTLSDYLTEGYALNGELLFSQIGKSQFENPLGKEPIFCPAPYCPLYYPDTTKYNHFVFVVKSKWNYDEIYIDELFRKTLDGLKCVRREEQ